MELYQLRTFKMVAEERHLTRAAKRLHASQPAISAHIRSLEDELGVQLFQRTPRGMSLTDAGLRLKEHADKVMAVVEEMIREAGRMRHSVEGNLRIGINAEAESLRIPALFTVLRKRHPDLHVHLLHCMSAEVGAKLEAGELDAGFYYGRNSSNRIASRLLQKRTLVIASPSAWGERLLSCQAAELDRFPWILTPSDCPFHELAEGFFLENGVRPGRIVLADQEATIKSMVRAGSGISLLPEEEVCHEASEGLLAIWRRQTFTLPLSIACLARRLEEPMLQALLAILAQVWED